MSSYIDECKRLSLTARAAISLLIFERFCLLNDLNALEINEFLDHLWKWPLVDGPDEFEPWEANRVTLVNCGLGDDFSEDLLNTLTLSGVSEHQFRTMIGGITEILWGSFWGADNNELSIAALENVILASVLEQLPVLTPFKFSLFSQSGGWG